MADFIYNSLPSLECKSSSMIFFFLAMVTGKTSLTMLVIVKILNCIVSTDIAADLLVQLLLTLIHSNQAP